MEEEPRQETVLIKRYANRKLYNTNDSCYITLHEIAKMIKAGEEVKIIDYKTSEDITSVTLAQIVFEEEKLHKKLSTSTLVEIIASGGEAIQDFFSRTMKLGAIREEAERTVGSLEKLVPRKIDGKLFSDIYRSSQHNLEELQKKVDDAVRTALGPVTTFAILRKEISALKAEIELLEAKVGQMEELLEQREQGENTQVATKE